MAFAVAVTQTSRKDLHSGKPVVISETVINDSSKDLDFDDFFATASRFDINSIRVEQTTGATAGLRTITLTVLVGAEVVCVIPALTTVDVSLSKEWQFFQGATPAVVGGLLIEALPVGFFLAPGQTLRVALANSTPAEDTMIVHVNGLLL